MVQTESDGIGTYKFALVEVDGQIGREKGADICANIAPNMYYNRRKSYHCYKKVYYLVVVFKITISRAGNSSNQRAYFTCELFHPWH